MASKARKLIINAYQKQLKQEATLKHAKKGLLAKLFLANKKKSNTLVEILRESNNFNTVNSESFRGVTEEDEAKKTPKTDEEFLKKYYDMPKGGPKHSIAVSRAHHLTNFLTEYILAAFSSGLFTTPDISQFKAKNPDFQGDYAFEISRIELLADLTALNIHWLNSGNEKLDKFVENFLESNMRSYIRQTLTTERVMSYVPRIIFVRDETNALMKKLDEHLAQIKIETENAAREEEANAKTTDSETGNHSSELAPVVEAATKLVKKQPCKIGNLYGVDFNRLIERIKTGNSAECVKWSPAEAARQEAEAEKLSVARVKEKADLEDKKKFERSIKAFEINKRMKGERLNRSALLRVAMLEYETKRVEEELKNMKN